MSNLNNRILDVIILCGGKGQRLRPLTNEIPKPMVNINNKPIIYYILNHLNNYRIENYIFATGYKSKIIEDYLDEHHTSTNILKVFSGEVGIIKRIQDCLKFIKNDFLVLYGDTIADVNIDQLINFNYDTKHLASITMYEYKSSFGLIEIDKNHKVISFLEKPILDRYINIGYFYFRKKVKNDIIKFQNWENFIQSLISNSQLSAFKHNGLHLTVNTMDELNYAENNIDKIYLKNKL